MTGDGRFAVAWQDRFVAGSHNGIAVRGYSSAGALRAAANVSTDSSSTVANENPLVALDDEHSQVTLNRQTRRITLENKHSYGSKQIVADFLQHGSRRLHAHARDHMHVAFLEDDADQFALHTIVFDHKRILPCAAWLEGEYGMSGLFLGVGLYFAVRPKTPAG